jgi:hypothetical protein
VYAALKLTPEQTQHARDVLRIQRDRVSELGQALRERKLSLEEFRKAMRELGAETDRNLLSVIGEKKLQEWRDYQGDQDPPP